MPLDVNARGSDPHRVLPSSTPSECAATDAAPDSLPDTLRVLLVEDDAPTRQLVPAMLPEGWTCKVASSAAEARAAMGHTSHDVALIDIRLDAPGNDPESGVELLEAMDEHGNLEDTCAIAVTAHALPGDRERFLEAGFDAYVAKPFTKDQLLGAIASALAELGGRRSAL